MRYLVSIFQTSVSKINLNARRLLVFLIVHVPGNHCRDRKQANDKIKRVAAHVWSPAKMSFANFPSSKRLSGQIVPSA